MLQNVTDISLEQLKTEVQQRFDEGWRFITVSCIDEGDRFTLLYSFDQDSELIHLRTSVTKGTPVPSVSGIYFCALLVENEIKDLFGVPVQDIVIDYGGRLLLADEAPLAPQGNACSPAKEGE